ncbi:hypothetical protein DN402_31620 [Streptomyces sp. SW4]|nr:hypothetical protein DN402_31620 [Streptomyces sp. SW4]
MRAAASARAGPHRARAFGRGAGRRRDDAGGGDGAGLGLVHGWLLVAEGADAEGAEESAGAQLVTAGRRLRGHQAPTRRARR